MSIPEPTHWIFVKASLIVGFLFSPLAAAMAFLITYTEYRRHFPDAATAIRHALQVAVVTLVAFLALSALAGLVVGSQS